VRSRNLGSLGGRLYFALNAILDKAVLTSSLA